MKKFKFNLETVLKYRESIESFEKNVLSTLNGHMIMLLNQLENLKKSYENALDDFEKRSAKGMLIQEVLSCQAIIKGIELNIESKLDEIEEHRKKITKQTTVVVKATQDKKTIDKLKENNFKKYTKAENKAEELYIEEFVSNKISGDSQNLQNNIYLQ